MREVEREYSGVVRAGFWADMAQRERGAAASPWRVDW